MRSRSEASPASGTHARVVRGVGYTIAGSGDFVGFYRISGTASYLYCPNPRAATPVYLTASTTSRLTIMNTRGVPVTLPTTTQYRVAYLLSGYGHVLGTGPAARIRAAAVSQALNTLVGNTADVARRARALPAAVGVQARQLLASAVDYAGPYYLRVGPHPALSPGQRYRSWAQLLARSGRAVPGQRFSFSASGADVTSAVVADRHGTARFEYASTDTGWLRLAVRAEGVAGAAVVASPLKRGVQRLLGPAPTGTVAATLAMHKTIGGAEVSYACRKDCAGRPNESVRDCLDAGTAAARFTILDNGRSVKVVATRPASRRQCVTAQVAVPDAHRLTIVVSYRAAKGWTKPEPVGGPVIIDCPPPPTVQVQQSCSCSSATLVATLSNTSDHTQAIVVNGGFTASQGGRTVSTTVRPGATLRLTFEYQPGRPLDVRLAGAAERRGSRQWNVGMAVETRIAG